MNFATLAYMTGSEFANYINRKSEMTNSEMLNILRNPYDVPEEKQREARLWAADIIEEYIREQAFRRVNQHKRG